MLYYDNFESIYSAIDAMCRKHEPLVLDMNITLDTPLVIDSNCNYVYIIGKKTGFTASRWFPVKKMIYINVTRGGTVYLDNLFFHSQYVPKSPSGYANDTVYIDSAKTVTVSNCNFNSDKQGSDSLLFVSDATNIYVYNNTFNGALDSAVYISGKHGYGENAYVMNNIVTDSNVGVIFKRSFRTGYVKDNIFLNTRIPVATGCADGYKLPGKNFYITNNFMYNPSKAVNLKDQVGTYVMNNNIRDLGKSHNPAVGIDLQGCQHCVVENNTIQKNPLATVYTIRHYDLHYNGKVYLDKDNVIKNNIIYNY